MNPLKRQLGSLVCALRGHATGVWYAGPRKDTGAPTEVLACPRCRVVLDVRRAGSRKVRRQLQRDDWRRQGTPHRTRQLKSK